MDVVTGAFSFTGRAIAEELLTRGRKVRTLARRRASADDPLAGGVEWAPLGFAHDALVESLRGADVLYNTYWIRFERGGSTFARAVENTAALLAAAREVGVRRVVHVSVANPSESSPFAYFRGKAQTEQRVVDSGLSWAVVRPTLVFGPSDILLNNIAWTLRRLPLFAIAGDGRYRVQPVSVGDVARLCVDAGARDAGEVLDAAGPDTMTYAELVEQVSAAIGRRARLVRLPTSVVAGLARIVGAATRDVLVTGQELGALRAGLLVSHEPPRGTAGFGSWLETVGDTLGVRYASELERNFGRHDAL